jgi:hypothetical protein
LGDLGVCLILVPANSLAIPEKIGHPQSVADRISRLNHAIQLSALELFLP